MRTVQIFLLLGSLTSFLLVGEYARASNVSSLDLLVFRSLNALSGSSFLDAALLAVTQLGTTVAWIALTVVLTALSKQGRKRVVVLLFATLVATELLVLTLKPLYQRRRPFETLEVVVLASGASSGFSFPSGHVLRSFAGSFMLVHLRRSVGYLLIVASVPVALSRVYLGLHYPSDALGSVLLAYILIELIILAEGYLTLRRERMKPSPL